MEIPPLYLIHSNFGEGFATLRTSVLTFNEVLGGHKPKESTTSKALLADTFRYKDVLATL